MLDLDALFEAARDEPPFANGAERYDWMHNWCDRCIHDRGARDDSDPAGCPLIRVALLGRTPAEWRDGPRDEHGRYAIHAKYECARFEPDPEVVP